ncbi:unnamed protein product [Rotaria sordida]|uniref:Uncharacterized protein n=1 Tax=Rotaria sordida TaxID=392033 RepID=A0A815N8R6_9BILA|nr:unnamed protein product [Rotaria sordida]
MKILNFVRTSSITDEKLDRFCTYILPRKHNYIRKLILDTTYMERILLAGNYPNVSYLELFNFKQEIILHNFTENSVFRHIFQHQITDLILHNNDEFIFVVTLLRRMTHLEKLTLYLRILKRHIFDADTSPYVDGTYLQNEILVHMSQLHTFKFYISTETRINYSIFRISGDDIRQTFTNIKYGQTACIIDDFGEFGTTCHVYSLPFTFTRLEKITTHFPFTVFDTVTHLSVRDFVPFEHEFFMRISQAFPLLKCFSINNWQMQYRNCNDNSSYSVIEFTHLISLNMVTRLPRLTQLKVNYYDLKSVTMNFTRDETSHNCSKVNRLIVGKSITFSKDFHQYFPLL